MQVQIQFFATLRDRAGVSSAAIDLPEQATVATLKETLTEAYPKLREALDTTLIAINHEYAFPDDLLHNGDEVALFPPVSGGAGWPEYFAITEQLLDIDEIVDHITSPETGAVCVFSGVVRGSTQHSEGTQITEQLHYDAYTPMAENKLRQVAAEIRERWPAVQGIGIVQRIGRLNVGETTVLIACASGHRNDGCFEAAQYGINRLKEIVPVWKKEIGPEGSQWVEGHYQPTPDDVHTETD